MIDLNLDISKCPFCGNDNTDYTTWKENDRVTCLICGATVSGLIDSDVQLSAVEKWNSRN